MTTSATPRAARSRRLRRGDVRTISRAQRRADAEGRADGALQNALTGAGVRGVDLSASTVRAPVHLSPSAARLAYRNSWAAKTEIDRPANDASSQGFGLEDLPPEVDAAAVISAAGEVGRARVPEDLGLLAGLRRLNIESGITGGGALVIVVRDGLEAWEPLDLTRIETIVALELLERDEITPYFDGSSNVPEHYIIGTSSSTLSAASMIHRSRIILGLGSRLSPREERLSQGWGSSKLELLHHEREAMHLAAQEMAAMVLKATYDVVFFAELAEILCPDEEDPNPEATIDDRLTLLQQGATNHRMVPLDGGRLASPDRAGRAADKLESVARPVAGFSELLREISDYWAGATGQGPKLALGRVVGGLNNGGDDASAWQGWGSRVAAEQASWWRPRLDYLLEILFASLDGPTGGVIPATWKTVFDPIWQPSAAEQATTRKTMLEGDALLVAMTAATSAEVRQQRLETGNTGELRLEPMPDEDPAEGETVELDAEGNVVPEKTAGELAWSTSAPPADAKEASVIAGELGIPTVRITRAHREERIEGWNVLGGKPRYSTAEVRALILSDNGKLPAPADEEPAE